MLEAKASWGHTGIAGGFIVPRYKKRIRRSDKNRLIPVIIIE
ncbi:hypothetical protein [Lacrimispora amygdalina]|nr:hypothetical protein [Clostridium indicum]